MTLRPAPQFQVAPVPDDDEAAAIAAAIAWLLEQEAAAAAVDGPLQPPGVSPWVAWSRAQGRGMPAFRTLMSAASAWRLSGRS